VLSRSAGGRRAIALWLVLFAVYAATLGLDAFADSDYAGDEPHHLLAAQSLAEDRDLDVSDSYRERAYRDFYPYPLDMHGRPTNGRLHEPHGAGYPLIATPAFELAGARGVELLAAGLAALAMTLAYLLALRVAPDPWALGAALAVGLSPPLLAYGTAVYPELAAGAALAGAALLATRLDSRVSRASAFGCFALLGALPWLGLKFVPAGLVIAVFAIRSLRRARRRLLALGGAEVALLSGAFYVGVNEGLYGGPTPYAADFEGETATDADTPLEYLGRAYRLGALLLDRDYGLLRWAPVFALALLGAWLLRRARRERLVRVVPSLQEAERTATMCALAAAAQLGVAAFAAPTMFGFWFPPRHLLAALPLAVPLVAWGLRHSPRLGTALAAIGVAGSAWLYLDVRLGGGGLALDRPDAPWGPLVDVFPFFADSALPYALTAVGALVLLALALREEWSWRRTAGTTRAKYSG
jgi:hypothetical protein